MKIVDDIREQIERLLTSPSRELGRWARFARFQLQLWRSCARRLWEHNVTAMSAALSFRTIFAMVPAIVLAVLVVKSVGALENSKRDLRRFLDRSGFAQIAVVESGGDDAGSVTSDSTKTLNVADEIEDLVEGVEAKLSFERIGPVGAVLLVWTALTLLTTIERSLNRIFAALRPRPLGRRLLLYWSVLTLGPLVWVAASYAGRQVAQGFERTPGVSWVLGVVGWVGPMIVGVLVLATVYKLLPNTAVRYRAAVGGAVVSVPLWLAAKWGFAVYVTKLVGTGNLYGALGLLPLFLVWLNLSWLIFLFGAELAHTAANLTSIRIAEEAKHLELGPTDLLAAAIAVAEPFVAGDGPATVEHIADRLRLPRESVQWLLDRLEPDKVVCRVDSQPEEESYVLARPAQNIRVLEILGVDSRGRASTPGCRYDPAIARIVAQAQARARAALGSFTLAEALAGDERRSRGGAGEPRSIEQTPTA